MAVFTSYQPNKPYKTILTFLESPPPESHTEILLSKSKVILQGLELCIIPPVGKPTEILHIKSKVILQGLEP